MLLLGRKPGEKIKVGNDVTITITRVRGDKVTVGIDAPKEIAVHRQEVVERIKKDAA